VTQGEVVSVSISLSQWFCQNRGYRGEERVAKELPPSRFSSLCLREWCQTYKDSTFWFPYVAIYGEEIFAFAAKPTTCIGFGAEKICIFLYQMLQFHYLNSVRRHKMNTF